MINAEDVEQHLSYDPLTGEFTWKKSRYGVSAGQAAGCVTANGYICIGLNNEIVLAHRLAWFCSYGNWPEGQIDHINGRRSDNRLANLRDVTNQENQRNRKVRHDSLTGVTGVGWCRQTGKWRAKIGVDYKIIHLGRFDNQFEAICARKSAELRFGFYSS